MHEHYANYNKYFEFLLHLIFIQTNEARDRLSTHWIKNSFIFEIFDGGGGSLYADLYIFFFQFSQFLSVCYCIIMN